jgi:hypothetical protein
VRRARGLVGLLVIVGCAGSPTMHTARDPAAVFTNYRTFSIGAAEGPPAGFHASSWSPELQLRLEPLVTAALRARGYSPVSEHGDLVVTFGSGRRQVSVHETSGMSAEWLPADENAEFVEGALVIDAFDASTRARVWHGWTEGRVRLDRIDAPQLAQSVRGLLGSFPSSGGEGP